MFQFVIAAIFCNNRCPNLKQLPQFVTTFALICNNEAALIWYAIKSFISTFPRAQIFTIQGSFLLIYKQELKSGKVTSFFSKSVKSWKKIFISRYDIIMFIYKSWPVNSGWLTLFVCYQVKRGDSFAFKMLVTIISLQEESF